jgi:hypothetical protein
MLRKKVPTGMRAKVAGLVLVLAGFPVAAQDVLQRMHQNKVDIEKARDELLHLQNGRLPPTSSAGPDNPVVETNLNAYFAVHDVLCDEENGFPFATALFEKARGHLWPTPQGAVDLVADGYRRSRASKDKNAAKAYDRFLNWMGVFPDPLDSESETLQKISKAVIGIKLSGCTKKRYFVLDTACHDLTLSTGAGQTLRFRYSRPVDIATDAAAQADTSEASKPLLEAIYNGDGEKVDHWLCSPTLPKKIR